MYANCTEIHILISILIREQEFEKPNMINRVYSGYTDIQFIKFICSFNVQIWSNTQTFAKVLSKITTNKGKICQKD